MITAHAGGQDYSGELILVGNGKFYGGRFEIFPGADLRDGLLDVCVVPRVNFAALLRCGLGILTRRRLPEKIVRRFRAAAFELSSGTKAAFELDGEWAGNLPVKFSVERGRLRVVC
jgi:diacylglycerol kinase family enzyme